MQRMSILLPSAIVMILTGCPCGSAKCGWTVESVGKVPVIHTLRSQFIGCVDASPRSSREYTSAAPTHVRIATPVSTIVSSIDANSARRKHSPCVLVRSTRLNTCLLSFYYGFIVLTTTLMIQHSAICARLLLIHLWLGAFFFFNF